MFSVLAPCAFFDRKMFAQAEDNSNPARGIMLAIGEQ